MTGRNRGSDCRVSVNACRMLRNDSRRFARLPARRAFLSARVSFCFAAFVVPAGFAMAPRIVAPPAHASARRDGLLMEPSGAVGGPHERPAHDTGEAEIL